MPIQAPQWTDYLNCPVCCREFGAAPRSPVSLACGHTICKHCLTHLHRRQCPFDQSGIQLEPEEMVVNTALLQLAGYAPPAQPYHPPCILTLPEPERRAYDVIVKCLEELATYLKLCGNANNNQVGGRLSRPMQRKLVTLVQCAITDEDGRGRAARAARSLGERTVTELILQHQNPQQLSANLWAAVRARGCQFLGPAMQEEVLKLVLLALEDGSALSRKVLVMFVVQRLEPHFPQASKTSIGHVVQLLYRASCFKVSKRESDSSLMQLKDEFRTYETLRREHDAQIVQIATEAGLRIAPDQWSALLYGDTAHKSHMQSIIDKLQTPQSFAQSVQELFIALQRTGDPAQLVAMSLHLDRLASIDTSPDATSPSWQQLADVLTSLKEVVSGLLHYLQQQATGRDANHNQKLAPDRPEPSTSQLSPQSGSTPTHGKYKVSMCRDAAARLYCPRGGACTFAHSEEELDRYRSHQPVRSPVDGSAGSYPYGVLARRDAVPSQMYGPYAVPPVSNYDMLIPPTINIQMSQQMADSTLEGVPTNFQQVQNGQQQQPHPQPQPQPHPQQAHIQCGMMPMIERPFEPSLQPMPAHANAFYNNGNLMGNYQHPNGTQILNGLNQNVPVIVEHPYHGFEGGIAPHPGAPFPTNPGNYAGLLTVAPPPPPPAEPYPGYQGAYVRDLHPQQQSVIQAPQITTTMQPQPTVIQGPQNMPATQNLQPTQAPGQNIFVPIHPVPSRDLSPYAFDELQSDIFSDSYRAVATGRFAPRSLSSPTWSPPASEDVSSSNAELEREIQALTRRLDIEFSNK